MGLFDFFKKKKAENTLNEMARNILLKAFPGGNEEIITIVNCLYEKFNHKYAKSELTKAVKYTGTGLMLFEDKSAHRIVDVGLKPQKLVDDQDALVIYKDVVRNFVEKKFGKGEEVFKAFYQSLGNFEGKRAGDVMPGAYGPYGTVTTNPIPINGVSSSYTYLNRLRLANGDKVKYERIGSMSSEITDEIIDGYNIFTEDGKKLTTIYICPYVNASPTKAPEGFILA